MRRSTNPISIVVILLFFAFPYILNLNHIDPSVYCGNYISSFNIVGNVQYPFSENIVKEIVHDYVDYGIKHISEDHLMLDDNLWDVVTVNKMIQSSFTYITKGTHAHLKNVYVNEFGGIASRNRSFSFKGPTPTYVNRRAYVVGEYDNVIAIGHPGLKFYSGQFLDVFPPLMMLPTEFFKTHYLIYPPKRFPAFLEIVHALGFSDDRIIMLRPQEWIFARNAHTLYKPFVFLSYYGNAMRNLSRMLRDRLGLNSIPANQFALCNRQKGLLRHIGNFDDFVAYVRNHDSKHNWIVVPDTAPTIAEVSRYMASIAVLFTPVGSNLVHTLFMKPDTAVCCAMGIRFDWDAVGIVQSIGLYLYCFAIPKMQHFYVSPNKMDIQFAYKALMNTVHVYENKVWPNNILTQNSHQPPRQYHYFPEFTSKRFRNYNSL